jgi:hypothetical protein
MEMALAYMAAAVMAAIVARFMVVILWGLVRPIASDIRKEVESWKS